MLLFHLELQDTRANSLQTRVKRLECKLKAGTLTCAFCSMTAAWPVARVLQYLLDKSTSK